MVEFSRYIELAYEISEEKGIDGLEGPGSQPANQRFMSQLAEAYNENDHAEASESDAEAFLRENVAPP
jgi:hypothetical protein